MEGEFSEKKELKITGGDSGKPKRTGEVEVGIYDRISQLLSVLLLSICTSQ